ncbi:protein YgfX [Vibrio metoecus]|uniref:protein YgfX n=2 Tax=Vibrio metoecus TaxID=1481663 RepID=UPI003466098C
MLTSSYYAQFIACLILMLMLWALFVSSIPLVLVPFFSASIWRGHHLRQWMPSSLTGDVELTFCGSLEHNGQHFTFHTIQTLYAPLFITLQGPRQRWFIWRDSCDDATYRQLLVRLKRELNSSRDNVPIS